MDVPVELLAYNVWAAEDDITGFLIVWGDIFDQLYLKDRPISLPMVPTEYFKMKIWEMRIIEKTYQIEIWFFKWMIKIFFWVIPPIKTKKIVMGKSFNLDDCLLFL